MGPQGHLQNLLRAITCHTHPEERYIAHSTLTVRITRNLLDPPTLSPPSAQVKANGLVVFVPKYGIEGPVYLAGPKDKNNHNPTTAPPAAVQPPPTDGRGLQYILDEEAQTVRSTDGSVAFSVFDKCAVRISVEVGVAHRRSLVLQLVERGLVPESERVG